MIASHCLKWPIQRLCIYKYYEPVFHERLQYKNFRTYPYLSVDQKPPNVGLTPQFETSESVFVRPTGLACQLSTSASARGKCFKTAAAGRQASARLKRAEYSGKCRWGFIPEEFFTFFYPITGVSGPYFFVIGVTNYLLSKEIYILEHEYYIGLSILVMVVYVTKVFGKQIGASLDKLSDEVLDELEKGRKKELEMNKNVIDTASDLQMRAEAQKLLMDAKRENIKIQLEAIYRERYMLLYQRVRNRMDYHVNKHFIQNRIKEAWMLEWMLAEIMKSITPEFERRAMLAAIDELAAAAEHIGGKK